MASTQSAVMRLIARYFLKSHFNPTLKIGALRKSDEKFPKARMAQGCTIKSGETSGVGFVELTPDNLRSESILLYVHGGAYVSGPNQVHWQTLASLGQSTGRRAVMARYRLAPEFTARHALDDVIAVYDAVHSQHNGPHICLLGDSAGAGLALATLFKLRETGKPLPARLVLLSPWLDVALNNPRIAAIERHDPMLARPGLREAGQRYAGDLGTAHPTVSPIHGDLAGLPPTLLLIGTHDILLPDCRKFREKARAAGVPLTYQEWEKMFHVWMLMADFIPEAQQALQTVIEFISQG